MSMEPITSQASQRLHRCESREDDPRTLRLSPPWASVTIQGQSFGQIVVTCREWPSDREWSNEYHLSNLLRFAPYFSNQHLLNYHIPVEQNSNFRKEEWAYLDRSCTLCLFTLVSCVCPSLLQSGKSQTVAIGKYLHLTSRRQAYPPHLSKPTTEHLSKTWISWTRERSCNWRLSYAGPVELMAISQSAVLAINFDRCHY